MMRGKKDRIRRKGLSRRAKSGLSGGERASGGKKNDDREGVGAPHSLSVNEERSGRAGGFNDADPLLQGLNQQQVEAVRVARGPVKVVAGAGSGKTRVLTHRVAYLIGEMGVSPDSVLAVTFTNKAAREMRDRVRKLLGVGVGSLWVSTFHSACARVLRREGNVAGYDRDYSILDRADSVRLVEQCVRQVGRLPRDLSPWDALEMISKAKNDMVGYEEFERTNGQRLAKVSKVYRLYQERLQQESAMDFDDLLMNTVRLFQEVPQVLEEYRQRFGHVLVDEYQDTNYVQYLLVKQLALKHRNLFIVGDSDQSIYGFRGADYRNVSRFDRDFPEASRIVLSQNYRSTSTILHAANRVIRHNYRTDPKDLWCDGSEGKPIVEYRGGRDRPESLFVAQECKNLVKQGYTLRDIAILFRTRRQSAAYQRALRKTGLPFQVVGKIGLYDRKEVKDLIAYLGVVHDRGDRQALQRIINTPSRGIGPVSLGRLERFALKEKVSLWEALTRVAEVPSLSAPARVGASKLAETIENAHRQLTVGGLGQAVSAVLFDAGLAEMYGSKTDPGAEGQGRNLAAVARMADELDAEWAEGGLQPMERLGMFLEGDPLSSEIDSLDNRLDAVKLMTVHSAKGLEFPVVFLGGLIDGVFPHRKSLSDPREFQEERRLFYVAITRAMERLYLTYNATRASGHQQTPSRFLREVPRLNNRSTSPRRTSKGLKTRRGKRRKGFGGWPRR